MPNHWRRCKMRPRETPPLLKIRGFPEMNHVIFHRIPLDDELVVRRFFYRALKLHSPAPFGALE